QTLAAAAVEKLNEAAPKRIVVTCAHCFNTIRNEYPELGGNYQVIHHTELLSTLVAEGKLKPLIENGKHKVTLHDACYLGRHNGIYNAPRELLGALPGFEVTEMPRTKDRAMCCGAGGAHAFMQDTIGVRIADARVSEAAATGADTVATACPFCSTMLASGRPQEGEAPQVADVAILLRDAVLEKTVEEKPVQQEEEEDDWDDFFD
ncbi:MAG: (Fe-S)-binding protein, partial [Winkia neuii]